MACCVVKAQLRDPSPEEKKALDKVVPVIEDILDHFNSNDWDKAQDYYNNDIAVNPNPDVPLDINCNFEREYKVKMNSDRYNSLIKPLVDKIMDASQKGDYQTTLSLGKQNELLSRFTVDVYINRKIAEVTGKRSKKITVNGVPYAYHLDEDSNTPARYCLLFGNWATARPNEYGLGFHFIHPHKTPFIENVAFIIQGADDRVQQLLKTINWSEVQNALTL